MRDLPTTYRGGVVSASGYWADPSAFEHMPLVDTRVLKKCVQDACWYNCVIGWIADLPGMFLFCQGEMSERFSLFELGLKVLPLPTPTCERNYVLLFGYYIYHQS